MNNPLRSNLLFWISVGYGLGYVAFYYLFGYAVMAYGLSALSFGLSVVVLTDWAPTAWKAIKKGQNRGDAILAYGLCILALYTVYVCIWAVLRVALQYPEWMDTSPFGQFPRSMLLLFFTCVILATGTRDGEFPRRSLIQYGIALFLAGLFTGVVVAFAMRPDIFPQMGLQMGQTSNLPRLNCSGEKPVAVQAYCRALPTKKIRETPIVE